MRSGTSKGSTISQLAAVHSGHYPPRPNRKKKKKKKVRMKGKQLAKKTKKKYSEENEYSTKKSVRN